MKKFEPWPWASAAMLLGMIASSLTFYAVAASHPDAEVVSDSYAAGLRYGEELRRVQAGRELGVAIELARIPGSANAAQGFRATLRDAGGAAVRAEEIRLRGERPAESGLDWVEPLRSVDGGYEVAVGDLRPGHWRLVVEARIEGRDVIQRFRHFEVAR